MLFLITPTGIVLESTALADKDGVMQFLTPKADRIIGLPDEDVAGFMAVVNPEPVANPDFDPNVEGSQPLVVPERGSFTLEGLDIVVKDSTDTVVATYTGVELYTAA